MNYENLLREMRSLAEHVSYPITNLANASALIFEELDRLNWAGFSIWKDGEIWGVLDIDSPEKGRFDEKDQEGLEAFAKLIEEFL